ncbi:MAG: hypothetical protein EXR94_02370 [Gemmatimonadetes bacterium]|nr:hypothetical protein [Gemmatimonadota bacterium]
MTCDGVRDRLDRHLAGTLDPAKSLVLTEHAAGCAGCRVRLCRSVAFLTHRELCFPVGGPTVGRSPAGRSASCIFSPRFGRQCGLSSGEDRYVVDAAGHVGGCCGIGRVDRDEPKRRFEGGWARSGPESDEKLGLRRAGSSVLRCRVPRNDRRELLRRHRRTGHLHQQVVVLWHQGSGGGGGRLLCQEPARRCPSRGNDGRRHGFRVDSTGRCGGGACLRHDW